jgi:pilus assembly protein FimV
VAENWWVAPLALLAAVLVGLAVVRRRRKPEADEPLAIDPLGRGALAGAARKGSEAFVVEESGERPAPAAAGAFADSSRSQSPDDTLSNEGPVNLDQGDPLAEADFHMAYGLYDQAAELVRIALEREPERRDLRLKLLEVYFVWGNREAFLQTAKTLEATRDRAPAGEWDKIVIMGRQICPDEPLFAASAGGRGAGAPVDLNLEGGENRVDIDLFGDPEGETRELDHPNPKVVDATAATAQFEGLRAGSEQLDFTLDAPERGADHGSSRAMPARDEPTVESELMNFGDADFIDPPAHDATTAEVRGLASKLPPKADQTAEVSIDDLGLDLDHLDQSETASRAVPTLEDDVQPADAPTRVIAVDEPTRRLLAEADWTAREHGLTDAQRELEASFAAELSDKDDLRTAVLLPLPDSSPTALFKPSDLAGLDDADEHAIDSTSTLRAIRPESIDPDLEQLAAALGNDDTLEQPRAAEDLFSNDVFEPAPRGRKDVDLDTGEPLALDVADSPTNRMTAQTANLTAQTGKLRPLDLAMPELEPVTMSEVGTKLDLARAYMDMGDPEGARSILEEVVEEGSVSQKQEASRLIESLPG